MAHRAQTPRVGVGSATIRPGRPSYVLGLGLDPIRVAAARRRFLACRAWLRSCTPTAPASAGLFGNSYMIESAEGVRVTHPHPDNSITELLAGEEVPVIAHRDGAGASAVAGELAEKAAAA